MNTIGELLRQTSDIYEKVLTYDPDEVAFALAGTTGQLVVDVMPVMTDEHDVVVVELDESDLCIFAVFNSLITVEAKTDKRDAKMTFRNKLIFAEMGEVPFVETVVPHLDAVDTVFPDWHEDKDELVIATSTGQITVSTGVDQLLGVVLVIPGETGMVVEFEEAQLPNFTEVPEVEAKPLITTLL